MFWSQHLVACAPPRPAKGRAGCWVREGVAPSRCMGLGVSPPKFFWKTQMLNPVFWPLLARDFFLLFENYGQEVGGPIQCWFPT